MIFAKYPQTLAFFVAFVADRGFREFHRVLHPRGPVPREPQVIAIGGTVEETWLAGKFPTYRGFSRDFLIKALICRGFSHSN